MAADGSVFAGRLAAPHEIDAAIRVLTRTLRFKVHVEGLHYSGLTFEHLLQILDRQGRPFLRNTRSLRDHVAVVLRLAYDGARTMPAVRELEAIAKVAILDWIVRRRFGNDSDVRLRALTPAYARSKVRAGYLGPIGVRRGALRDAVATAVVEIE